jgi:hypothetical protein
MTGHWIAVASAEHAAGLVGGEAFSVDASLIKAAPARWRSLTWLAGPPTWATALSNARF